MAANEALSLGEKVLAAAAAFSEGDVERQFTAEDLVVAAWRQDKQAFGLRGHEENYPDSNKVYTKLDGQAGLVTKGWLQKSGDRTLRLTIGGLARAAELQGSGEIDLQGKLDRKLQEEVGRILNHPEFQSWLKDRTKPSKFRGAGHFWDIAPGTPSSVVRSRIISVEITLAAAAQALEERGLAGVVKQRGVPLFERRDIDLALDFHRTLIARFRTDLKVLDPETSY